MAQNGGTLRSVLFEESNAETEAKKQNQAQVEEHLAGRHEAMET